MMIECLKDCHCDSIAMFDSHYMDLAGMKIN